MIHRWRVRVYHEDVDLAGVVYYANWLKFWERGRSEALRALGVDQPALAAAGLLFVVARAQIRYRAAGRFDDLIDVETEIRRVRGASVELAQRGLRDGALLTEGEVTVAAMSAAGGPARLPAEVRTKLAAGAAPGPG